MLYQEPTVKINHDIVSNIQGCDGNYHEGISNLAPNSALLHGYIEDMGDAESIEVSFQVIPADVFEDKNPTDSKDWENLYDTYGMSFIPADNHFYQPDDFTATASGLDDCREYFFRIYWQAQYDS